MLIEHPMVPITVPLMHGMCEGAKVEVDGMPYAGEHHGFTVEFLTAKGSLVHMDVRFQARTIVLNNFDNDKWHREELVPLPFCIGAHFHLKIKNHPGHFTIYVNGAKIAHFDQRGNPHHITAFHIRGDVAVHKIYFHHFSHPIVYTPVAVVAAPAPPVVVAPPPPVVVATAPPMVPPPPPVVVAAPPPVVVAAPVPPPPTPVVVAAAPAVVVVEDHHHHHAGAAVAGAVVGGAVLGAALRRNARRHW